jgi:hypothetical protein
MRKALSPGNRSDGMFGMMELIAHKNLRILRPIVPG